MSGPDPEVGADDEPNPTADQIDGLLGAERTAGEYVTHGAPGDADALLDAPHDGDTPMDAPASGDAAIAAAEERAARTRAVNLDSLPSLPVPADTANLRQGPPLDPRCKGLLPLVGVWRGSGKFGNEPGTSAPDFGQQLTIAHDGRGFLRHESIAWHLDPEGGVTGPGAREVGFWLPQADGSIELLIAHSEGRIEVFYGQARTATSWGLSTDGVWRTVSGPPIVGATRLYGITPDGRLAYVEERAHTDIPLQPHASAALQRIAG